MQLTAAERDDFIRLRILSRNMRTKDDVIVLKQEVSAWVAGARTKAARNRRTAWTRTIRGAYAQFE